MCNEGLWNLGDAQDAKCYGVLSNFFFQAEDGIRDLVRSRGLGDVYKRQAQGVGHVQDLIGGKPRRPTRRLDHRVQFGDIDLLSLIHI
mgnify:CR=1 FL=1